MPNDYDPYGAIVARAIIDKGLGGMMPTFTIEAIADIFTYHSPTPDQVPKYERLRTAARDFATVLVDCTPSSADQTAALRLLRQAVMTANASIALEGKY